VKELDGFKEKGRQREQNLKSLEKGRSGNEEICQKKQ